MLRVLYSLKIADICSKELSVGCRRDGCRTLDVDRAGAVVICLADIYRVYGHIYTGLVRELETRLRSKRFMLPSMFLDSVIVLDMHYSILFTLFLMCNGFFVPISYLPDTTLCCA